MRFASCLTALGSSCFTIMPRLRGPFQRSQMWPTFQRRSSVDCVTMVTLPLAVVDGASGSQPGGTPPSAALSAAARTAAVRSVISDGLRRRPSYFFSPQAR